MSLPVPAGYRVERTIQPVAEPQMRTFFKGRAERTRDRLNRQITVPSYRYEVVRNGRRWAVRAFQNTLVPS